MSVKLDMSFWEIVASTIFMLGVGVVSGRILGVHRGFLRATAAGVTGSFVGLVIAALILRNESEDSTDNLVPIAFGFALLATMVISVAPDGGLRSGDGRWPAVVPAVLVHLRRPGGEPGGARAGGGL